MRSSTYPRGSALHHLIAILATCNVTARVRAFRQYGPSADPYITKRACVPDKMNRRIS
jgi:hypothetical protein